MNSTLMCPCACKATFTSLRVDRLCVLSTSRDWVRSVKSALEREFGVPGLLQLVVRWGRSDIAQLVLNDKELVDQRQNVHVQRAFQDALERANERWFDLALIDLLLDHGAEAEAIYLPDLFDMRCDSFGYCSELRAGKYNERPLGVRERIERLLSPASTVPAELKHVSPWHERHINLMLSLPVRGFDDYARRQQVVRFFDIMCWAILVGALDLAHRIWQRTSSPLRAGLIAESMCANILAQRSTREQDLLDAKKRFSHDTLGVLDNLASQEEARKLLTSHAGDFATLGKIGSQECDVLELAMNLGSSKALAHAYCQHVLDEEWSGRSALCGVRHLNSRPFPSCICALFTHAAGPKRLSGSATSMLRRHAHACCPFIRRR